MSFSYGISLKFICLCILFCKSISLHQNFSPKFTSYSVRKIKEINPLKMSTPSSFLSKSLFGIARSVTKLTYPAIAGGLLSGGLHAVTGLRSHYYCLLEHKLIGQT